MAASHQVGYIITVIVLIFIYIPVSLFSIFRLYSHTYRGHSKTLVVLLRKRYSSLSIICSIAYVIQFLDLTVWALAYTDWIQSTETAYAIVFIASFVHISTQFVFTFFLVLRYWLIHFHIKCELVLSNHKWKTIIDPDYQITEKREHYLNHDNRMENSDWILAHRHNFGNFKFCIKYASLVCAATLLIIAVSQICSYVLNNVLWLKLATTAIVYIIFSCLWGCLLYLYCKTPEFYDNLYVKKEMTVLFILMMVFFFIYIIFAIVFGFGFGDIGNTYSSEYYNQIMILFHSLAACNLLVIGIFTFYPLRKLLATELAKDKLQKKISKLSLTSALPAQNVRIEDVIKYKHGYEALIRHLSKEFSLEILLSLTEFIQFKNFILDHVIEMQEQFFEKDLILNLPFDYIPKSAIVYNDRLTNKMKAWRLWEKYIQRGCEYEINISYGLRNMFHAKMGNQTEWINAPVDVHTMSTLFDPANKSMRHLMNDSWLRFKSKEAYQKLLVQLHKGVMRTPTIDQTM